jgi:outer membrane protein
LGLSSNERGFGEEKDESRAGFSGGPIAVNAEGNEPGGVMQVRRFFLHGARGPWTLGLLLSAVAAKAQPSPSPLALDDCVRLALESDSSVAAARAETQIAALGIRQTTAALLPQARLGGSFTYNTPSSADNSLPSYVALNGVREYLALATASQELDTSGRLRAARARARADHAGAGASLEIARRDLKRQVAAAYYHVLLARHLAVAAKDALAESEAFESRTKQLLGEGEAARADVVKAGAQTALSRQAVIAADLDAELASHGLLAFWTKDVASPVELKDSLDEASPSPPPAPESADVAPFLSRPEFALLDAQRDGFLAAAKRARAERLPQANLMFQYGIDAPHLRNPDRGWAAFVNLDVPLFDGGSGRSAARQFELQAEQVESNRRGSERALSKDYEDAASRVRLMYLQIETTRTQVGLSEENLRLSRIRYDGGEGPALDVVAAQTALVQARTNLYTVVARYLESRADLDWASGR